MDHGPSTFKQLNHGGIRGFHGWLATGHFLNSTCDIGLSDMRQGLKIMTWDIAFSYIRHVTLGEMRDIDMRQCNFLKSTCEIGGPHQSPISVWG